MSLKFETPITEVPLFHQGKVRDMYDLGDSFLMVASDRLSAFDVVLPTPIPGKGKILNQLSLFSGWKDYQKTGKICGHVLPEGLLLCQKLEKPLYTPSTKPDVGHDENISFEQTFDIVGEKVATTLRDMSLDIYTKARDYAAEKGIILADTKFEFGEIDGETILIDEVLTPDSSRYWPADKYQVGKNQESFDKQYVRDWLETLDWGKTYPGPEIPPEVVKNTLAKYEEIFVRLTGKQPEL